MINRVSYPDNNRNYCIFNKDKVDAVVKKREAGLSDIQNSLEHPKSEDEILESLYELNLMLDNNVQGVEKLYPTLSKYNNTNSPYVQTFLAGIYRKIKVPDAFGPLCSMLIRNSINPPQNCNFDPNEEIGGAILDYIA